ncbi:MAG: hypothetical protein IKX71_01950 [Bacteroidales bacterium]|nr:hypothetical protein [Bacteroidales bacterium]
MKTLKTLTIICAIAVLSLACRRTIEPEGEVSATFSIENPVTKAFGDGASATELSVRVFDANHNFIYEQQATREESGWTVTLNLVPGTYSFSFWACSTTADAFSFEGEYMTLSYPLMDMNSDAEDAFWASVADMELTSSFERSITLKRPFAFMQMVSDSFINESLEGATSAFYVTGAICTRLNLITGAADEAVRSAAYKAAPVSDKTVGRHAIVAAAYALVPEEGVTLSKVDYTITLKDGRDVTGTVYTVPLSRNYRTSLKDY